MGSDTLPVVVYVFLLREQSVLVQRRSNTGFADGQYGVVGGHLERGETVLDAAIRECREEIGVELDASELQLIGMTHYVTKEGAGIDFWATARRWSGEPYPRSQCDDVRWCGVDQLPGETLAFVRRAIEQHLRRGHWFDELDWT